MSAPPPSPAVHGEWQYVAASSSAPSLSLATLPSLPPRATTEQLRALTAMPSSMVKSVPRANRGKRRTARLARDGQIVSKCFDALGSRPYPTNGLSLEQTIQVELTYTVQNAFTTGTTVGLGVFGALQTSIGAFSGSASALQMFDMYRMDQLEVWLDCAVPNASVAFPTLYSGVDLDDANVPTNVSAIQDKQGSLVSVFPGGHYHKFKPHLAVATYGGAFTSYGNLSSTWIDSGSPNVQHYGLKLGLVSNGAGVSVNLTVRGVFSFRAPILN